MAAEVASSPAAGFKTAVDELSYYKSQYEQVEAELQEFQQSSKELEAELEKDIDAAEKRERQLKEKAESLRYEVDEWKTKYKQSKAEANSAQNTLQKEITGLRDTNRTLQLKLRDVEVANDDFERQARHTTSSLEDIESKYNQTIEKGVMLEEEIKVGEQEREQLRIEAQRLRDELSDLKVEADILGEKLRAAEGHGARHLKRKSQLSETARDYNSLTSPTSEGSFASAMLSASTTTPPPGFVKSEGSVATSDATTPPSPPLSDVVAHRAIHGSGAMSPPKKKDDPNLMPRPSQFMGSRSRHARGASLVQPPVFSRSQLARPRPSVGVVGEPVARSESLHQIRGLISKMQRLEKRVQSARSKLPAPTGTPPRASPRLRTEATPGPGSGGIPQGVTVRSSRKQSSAATSTTASRNGDSEAGSRLSHHASRYSMGTHHHRTGDGGSSRPSSRISNAGHESTTSTTRSASRASNVGSVEFARPSSRTTGRVEYTRPGSALDGRRPSSAMSGSAGYQYQSMQQPQQQQQQHGLMRRQSQQWGGGDVRDGDHATPTLRRTPGMSNIPTPSMSSIPTPSGLARRQSTQALSQSHARRKSLRDLQPMGPPEQAQPSTDLGETY